MRSSMSGFSPFMPVPADTSTSSSNTMPPPRWLLTLISLLRSFISRSILFISVSPRSNTVGVHDSPPRLWEIDFIGSLHTIYVYLTGLLVTLMGIKYEGSSTNPFSDEPTLMMLFLISILVYIIALITLRRSNHMSDDSSKLMVGVCHISGAIACELLLLVLVSPVRSLLINVSSLALIVMLVLCYKYVLRLLHGEGTEEQSSEMVDLEAPTISTS